jgi:uncharacterized NAD-dependent epimerase/dehydratase family protein
MAAVQLRAEHASRTLELPSPYLLFLGDITEPSFAKTAFGLRDWAPEKCLGEIGLPGGSVSVGLPRLSPAEARAQGARAMVVGIANPGGIVPRSWHPLLVEALEAGLDLIAGLHTRLGQIPELSQAAQRVGRRLIDVREPPGGIPVATGARRSGRRLLTVGTDCALGKKYTALALARAFQGRGLDAEFRATGQTGILIAGGGMPMDAVVADFEAGAAEMLTPDAADDHWDVIEGQGSLFHPAYAGVSLGLLHGSQPDVFVVCHQPGRERMMGYNAFALPSLEEVMELTLRLGRRTNPAIRCAGASLNTSAFGPAEAEALLEATAARLGLPAADPIRRGARFEALVESCLG